MLLLSKFFVHGFKKRGPFVDITTKKALYRSLQSALNPLFIAIFRNRTYTSYHFHMDTENCVLPWFTTSYSPL